MFFSLRLRLDGFTRNNVFGVLLLILFSIQRLLSPPTQVPNAEAPNTIASPPGQIIIDTLKEFYSSVSYSTCVSKSSYHTHHSHFHHSVFIRMPATHWTLITETSVQVVAEVIPLFTDPLESRIVEHFDNLLQAEWTVHAMVQTTTTKHTPHSFN